MELENTAMLAKLAPGGLIALDAKHQQKFLPKLYNRTRAADSTGGLDVDAYLHGNAFAELVAYMEDFCMEECVIPNLLIMHKYTIYRAQLDADIEGHIHTTRLIQNTIYVR